MRFAEPFADVALSMALELVFENDVPVVAAPRLRRRFPPILRTPLSADRICVRFARGIDDRMLLISIWHLLDLCKLTTETSDFLTTEASDRIDLFNRSNLDSSEAS